MPKTISIFIARIGYFNYWTLSHFRSTAFKATEDGDGLHSAVISRLAKPMIQLDLQNKVQGFARIFKTILNLIHEEGVYVLLFL